MHDLGPDLTEKQQIDLEPLRYVCWTAYGLFQRLRVSQRRRPRVRDRLIRLHRRLRERHTEDLPRPAPAP